MTRSRLSLTHLVFALCLMLIAAASSAGFATTVPVSAELATNIASSLYPQTIALDKDSLFVSDPIVSYPGAGANTERVSLRVNVQILRRQPDESLVATAPGIAEISGEIGYDRQATQILLINPRVDSLTLAPGEPKAPQLRADLLRQWDMKITNPMRVDVPGHPYLLTFKQGIRDITLSDEGIVIDVMFE